MPSVFETVTKAVVREMDAGGDMAEVRSIADAGRFRCYCLVRGRRGLFGRRYRSTGLTLEDILEMPGGEERFDALDSRLPGQKSELQVVDTTDCTWTLTVKLPKQITIEGGFQASHEQSIMILGSRISQQDLELLENRKLKRELPTSFQSMRTRREDLYLVTEMLRTERQETLKSEQQYTFLSQLDFCGLKSERKHQRAVTIPQDLVLGYRVKQLVFPSAERMNICFSGKTKSFPEEEDSGPSCLGKSVSLEDFRNVKQKVQDTVQNLQDLTEKEREDVLGRLTKCLTSEEELQALDERVSEVLVSGELQKEDSADPVISCLFNAAGILAEARGEAILNFLDALQELSEEKELVAETLKNGTLPLLKDQFLQFDGVTSVLEQEPSEQPQDVGCDLEAQTVFALYLVISVLLQLSEKPASVSSC